MLGAWGVLHKKIFRCAGHAVFVGSVIYHRLVLAESSWGNGRSQAPLQRCARPGIVRGRRSFKHTPEKVHKKDDLPGNCNDGCQSDETLQRRHSRYIRNTRKLRVTPRMSGSAEQVHRHEDGISAKERDPEVQLAQALV